MDLKEIFRRAINRITPTYHLRTSESDRASLQQPVAEIRDELQVRDLTSKYGRKEINQKVQDCKSAGYSVPRDLQRARHTYMTNEEIRQEIAEQKATGGGFTDLQTELTSRGLSP